MNIIFISNYFTHHQMPLCEALDSLTEHQFTFVETEAFPQERKKLGWKEQNGFSFVKQYEDFIKNKPNALIEADVVILGSAPLKLVQPRLKADKITFFYAERIYKKGYQPIKWLPRLITFWRRYGQYKSMYLLSASAYTSFDYAIHGVFLKKSYRWGYFPETEHYDTNKLFENKNTAKIMWCGRFLEWKHPEAVLEVAKRLKNDGRNFEIEFIGTGDLESKLKKLADDYGVSDHIAFLGAMNSTDVRRHMEQAGIYLFTSDFHEGWGAVLNEAMNSGCAVVASHAIGSAPFLLNHGDNGLIYHNDNIEELYEYVRNLIDDPKLQRKLGFEAYRTISQTWNAEVAAKRFLNLAEQIKNKGFCELYDSGPCSRTNIIRNNWY